MCYRVGYRKLELGLVEFEWDKMLSFVFKCLRRILGHIRRSFYFDLVGYFDFAFRLSAYERLMKT
jgi:hypothetical protein